MIEIPTWLACFVTGFLGFMVLGFVTQAFLGIRATWRKHKSLKRDAGTGGGDWTSERSRISQAKDDNEEHERTLKHDFIIMLEISPGGAATMKFTDATYLPDTQDSTHMIELARQIISFCTGRGYWVVTGVYREGEVITFEHIDGLGDHAGHAKENQASSD